MVEQNLKRTMNGHEPKAVYDGYGSCPVLTSYRKGILAEFTYDRKVAETFPFDQVHGYTFLFHLSVYFVFLT